MATSAIQAEGINKTYVLDGVEVPALRSVDLTVDRGEFVAIMGPRDRVSRPC